MSVILEYIYEDGAMRVIQGSSSKWQFFLNLLSTAFTMECIRCTAISTLEMCFFASLSCIPLAWFALLTFGSFDLWSATKILHVIQDGAKLSVGQE